MFDQIQSAKIGDYYIVGIDREAVVMGITVESYCRKIAGLIKESELTKELIMSVLANMDVIDYKKMSIVRIKVPSQKTMSYLGEKIYIRQHDSTVEVRSPKEAIIVNNLFCV